MHMPTRSTFPADIHHSPAQSHSTMPPAQSQSTNHQHSHTCTTHQCVRIMLWLETSVGAQQAPSSWVTRKMWSRPLVRFLHGCNGCRCGREGTNTIIRRRTHMIVLVCEGCRCGMQGTTTNHQPQNSCNCCWHATACDCCWCWSCCWPNRRPSWAPVDCR